MKRIMLIAIGMLAFAFYPAASQAAITSLTVTSITLSKSTGTITVTGTIVCTAGDNFFVDTDQLQANGVHRGFAFGTAPTNVCSGGVDTWVALETVEFGSIVFGNSQIFVQAFDITDDTPDIQVFHRAVTAVP
jgi:hypothetical protein